MQLGYNNQIEDTTLQDRRRVITKIVSGQVALQHQSFTEYLIASTTRPIFFNTETESFLDSYTCNINQALHLSLKILIFCNFFFGLNSRDVTHFFVLSLSLKDICVSCKGVTACISSRARIRDRIGCPNCCVNIYKCRL